MKIFQSGKWLKIEYSILLSICWSFTYRANEKTGFYFFGEDQGFSKAF